MKKILGIALCGLMSFTLVACGGNTESDTLTLSVGGSTSIQPLMEVIGEGFETEGFGIIDVQGGGSSVGTSGAIDGTFDIGMASRTLKDDELVELDGIAIAIDGIVMIVNKENKIKDISLEDAKAIYTGEITNWSALGGADEEIAVISREEGSGTRDGFQSVVGFDSEQQITNASVQSSTGAVTSLVSESKNAIGYISFGSLSDEVSALNVGGVSVSTDAINDESYQLSRPFNLAVAKGYDGAQVLIDFIFSEAGAKMIAEQGYIPTKLD